MTLCRTSCTSSGTAEVDTHATHARSPRTRIHTCTRTRACMPLHLKARTRARGGQAHIRPQGHHLWPAWRSNLTFAGPGAGSRMIDRQPNARPPPPACHPPHIGGCATRALRDTRPARHAPCATQRTSVTRHTQAHARKSARTARSVTHARRVHSRARSDGRAWAWTWTWTCASARIQYAVLRLAARSFACWVHMPCVCMSMCSAGPDIAHPKYLSPVLSHLAPAHTAPPTITGAPQRRPSRHPTVARPGDGPGDG